MKSNKTSNGKYRRGCAEKGTLIHCWWEGGLGQPLWKTVWQSLEKLRMELPRDPTIPLLGTCLKNLKTCIRKDICTPYVHCSTIHGGQDMEKTEVSFGRGLDKEDVVHMYHGMLLSHKKRQKAAICDNTEGP